MKNIIQKIKERGYKGLLFMGADIAAVLGCPVIALLLRFDFRADLVEPAFWDSLISYSWINVLCTVIVFFLCHLYAAVWSYAGITELVSIAVAVVTASLMQLVGMHIIWKLPIPRSYFILDMVLLFLAVVFTRFLPRLLRGVRYRMHERGKNTAAKTMLVGAGSAGSMVLKEIKESTYINRNVVCIIDDDARKHGNFLHGIPIVGGRGMISPCVEKYGIQDIIVAMPSADEKEKKTIFQICSRTGCKVSTLPGIYQLVNGEVHVSALRQVEIEDLLGRKPVSVNLASIMGYVSGRVVAVTGGGGSIGSELCRQIAKYGPKQLIIIDNYENNAYALQMELQHNMPELNLTVLIASVQDRKRIRYIFERYRPEILYHAAAHKHVPLMEVSPWEAIKNNVGGTLNVASEADRAGVQKMVMISTDKAVRPTNIMGASKRICEMIIQSWNHRSNTEYVAVRFGNVLGSNGSVIPLFKNQIAAGGPVTVTHPDIIRYFMTIPEAVSLVLQAGAYAKGGEIFILDMGEPVKILDLAENLIRLSGYKPYENIEIQFTGLRPGEKLYEELLIADERKRATENERIFVGHPIEFNEEEFVWKVKRLLEAAKAQNPHIKELVKEIVPEYSIDGKADEGQKNKQVEERKYV